MGNLFEFVRGEKGPYERLRVMHHVEATMTFFVLLVDRKVRNLGEKWAWVGLTT